MHCRMGSCVQSNQIIIINYIIIIIIIINCIHIRIAYICDVPSTAKHKKKTIYEYGFNYIY